MIDSHAHIDSEDFKEDFELMLKRAEEAGVENIIIPAIEPKRFEDVIEIVNKYPHIYCSMGIHPHNAIEYDDKSKSRILELLENPKTVAVGEIGLDYYYDFTPKDVQKAAFRSQIQIAKDKNLPLIIHNREADDDLYEILNDEQDGSLNGVLHCFSSSVEFMKKSIDLGFHISFTGNITFKKSNLNEVVEQTPLEKILIETDSPYMTPVPLRGKRNEPALVKSVAEKIAEIKKISIDEVIRMTTKNAKSLFKIATILLLLFAISNESYSQRSRTKVEENYYQEDSTDLEHPYKKVIGISPMIGTNTVVETYYDIDPTKPNSDKDISREGIFAYGASASYFLFDFLNIEFNYMYSKDMKIVETFKGTIDPNIYQIAEITTHWIPNPYNVINYFGTLGGTFFHTSINKVPTTNFGINFGVGFLINFNFDQYGILALQAEWRLDYGLTKAKSPYIEIKDGQTVITEKERTVYYSIPRFGLFWYPKF